ncbi:MAG: sigma-70 family RNA polymerase sigma factor [Candidatus Pacebacteria bacterium]|nr:sigma-70 family RNA polymerase sigma factor [Candidatus Paceibacterota bacterium]
MEQRPSLLPSDEEVVRMTLKDPNQYGLLMERYEAKLKRYITRLGVRNQDDQLDVLQEIFIKAYRNLNSFDTSLSFSSWIYRIAHNESISWYRKKNVRPEGHLVGDGDEILGFLASSQEGEEVKFDKVINAEEVNKALDSLDEKYREPIILRFFEHKEYDEISDILEIPIGSVGTLLHRGKKQLAHVLNKDILRI